MAPKVLVCSTLKPSEKIETLPITPRAGAEIVMRLGSKRPRIRPCPTCAPVTSSRV